MRTSSPSEKRYKMRRIRKETRRRTEEEKRDKDGWWRMEKEVMEVVTEEKT